MRGWSELIEDAVTLRRELHRGPELAWEEHETAARIRRELDRLEIEWRACASTGTVGVIAPSANGRNIALRADIDGLPIVEETGRGWASEVEGRMHACGHDGHTATLLAAAAWLKQHDAELPGPVTLLFQPAEEGGHGAAKMIEEGALEGVDAIFGWHNWPPVPFGHAACPDGPIMGANGTFSMELVGAGGHGSQPEMCRDPVLAAAATTCALQQIVSRRLSPNEPAVVSVTWIDAPRNDTTIPERAELGGTIRTANTSLRDRLFELIDEIGRNTATAHGVEAHLAPEPRYDATVNSPAEARCFRDALREELGEEWSASGLATPIMASEDFSYYLGEIPGAFALIGAGRSGEGVVACHSPHYDFNDDLIPVVVRLMARLVGAPLPKRGPA